MKFDMFVSYRRSDRELVAQVVRRLESHGVTAWYDANIEGGADWRETIVEALTDSAILVIFFSEACNASRQLKKELAVADNLAKPVVPILIEDTQPTGAYLYELADRNWIQAWPDPVSKLNELVGHLVALTAKAPPAPAPAPAGAAPEMAETTVSSTAAMTGPANDDEMVLGSVVANAYVGKKSTRSKRVSVRDILPFKWLDLVILLPVFGLTVFRALGPDGLGGTGEDNQTATIGLAVMMMIALYGAVAFPIRYYMRRRALGVALGKYLISTGILFGLAAAVTIVAAGAGAFPAENVAGALVGLILIWGFFTVIAFAIYGMLGGQRALRAFRSNIRKI